MSSPATVQKQQEEEIHVKRCGPHLAANKARVLLRRIYPGSHDIARRMVSDVMSWTEEERKEQLSVIMDEFGNRHEDVMGSFVSRFREVRANLGEDWNFDRHTRALIGAHFMHEYSIESAALFNPSIVPSPDQKNLPEGSTRFIVSLRATGEGHISSVAFREGVINKHNRVSLDPMPATIHEAKVFQSGTIEKKRFMKEMSQSHGVSKGWEAAHNQVVQCVLDELSDAFTIEDIRRACSHHLKEHPSNITDSVCRALLLIAEANYSVKFDSHSSLSQRVLFPSAPSQSNGIEDARFVLFTEEDGSTKYYATFTAYNGRSALPQLMETTDFETFRFMTLTGDVSNKGMALFPRKVGGKYWMLSRQDDVSVMIMSSETPYKWEEPIALIKPQQPWEIFKMGNCGSPLETPKGWLVLTHGVGPMRRYCIGAVMLDLEDPTKIIGRLKEPLIKPNEAEREGYVPNVVYTCGAMLHNGIEAIVPYAMSDSETSFATVSLQALYKRMGLDQNE
jgi:predicted GH43/DUF377 family glycosyl hydrolase